MKLRPRMTLLDAALVERFLSFATHPRWIPSFCDLAGSMHGRPESLEKAQPRKKVLMFSLFISLNSIFT